MKFLLLFFIAAPLLLNAQANKLNRYANTEAGFSISLNNNWKVAAESKKWNPMIFYNKPKNQQISIGLSKAPGNVKPEYTPEEAEATKAQIVEIFGKGNGGTTKLDTIYAYPDTFAGEKCITFVAHLKNPGILSGVPAVYKSIQFIHRGYLLNIVYCVPLANSGDKELKLIDSQLKMIKLF